MAFGPSIHHSEQLTCCKPDVMLIHKVHVVAISYLERAVKQEKIKVFNIRQGKRDSKHIPLETIMSNLGDIDARDNCL